MNLSIVPKDGNDPEIQEASEVEKAIPRGDTIVGIPIGTFVQIGKMPFKMSKIQGNGKKLVLEAVGFTMIEGTLLTPPNGELKDANEESENG